MRRSCESELRPRLPAGRWDREIRGLEGAIWRTEGLSDFAEAEATLDRTDAGSTEAIFDMSASVGDTAELWSDLISSPVP